MVATIAETTRQLGLTKEIQLDAQEMVRRAERGVDKAIRTGQDEGTVETEHEAKARGAAVRDGVDLTVFNSEVKNRPRDLASGNELSGNGTGIYAMTDDVTDEQIEEAVVAAKSEGKLSRANVVRKAKGEHPKLGQRHGARAALEPGVGWTATRLGGGFAYDHTVNECQDTTTYVLSTVPRGPGYCGQVALDADNPGYNTDATPGRRH